MTVHGVISAAVTSSAQNHYPHESRPFVHDGHPAAGHKRRVSYGTMQGDDGRGGKGKDPEPEELEEGLDTTAGAGEGDGGEGLEAEGGEEGDGEGVRVIDVTWRHVSRVYLLIPVLTLLCLAALILLVTYAWPPNKQERQHGQTYPHPFLWKPLLLGIFGSCTVQTLRVPIWEMVDLLPLSDRTITFSSTIIHALVHELLRLSTLPITSPSPTSGFHSSYYLGLGWGAAEVAWGIVQGYEQLKLYQEVMIPEEAGDVEGGNGDGLGSREQQALLLDGEEIDAMDSETLLRREDEMERREEEELERRVEVLERMRGRRELEEVMGVPFPTIPFPLHILWRLDTLLLNLGLTLILSAYYLSPAPILRHEHHPHTPAMGAGRPSPYLWAVWAGVAGLHAILGCVWKIVGWVGVGAVTWGGLIVALGSVFAGLGAWGGLV